MSADLDLSRSLTAVIAAVPGVGDVYPSGTLAQAVTLTIVNAATDDQTDDAKVAVSRGDSGLLTLTATIGVADGFAARVVLHEVTDALRAYLARQLPDARGADIHLKVSRIETEPAAG